jgi:hypothetical protein
MVVVRNDGLVTATGIASGINGEHYYQNSDAINPGISDHD